MKKLSFLYPIIVLFLSSSLTTAQPFNHQTGVPSIPSAAAMNYGAYADVPANLPTGTISTSVPIATLTEGPLAHTVSIDYQSVLRATDLPSEYGLSWHGSAGGLISRVINGVADDDDAKLGFYYHGNQLSKNQVTEVIDAQRDSESDLYVYRFGPFTGKFVFDKNGNVHCVPKSDIRIQVVKDPGFTLFKGFKATTPDGTVYHFGYDPVTTTSAKEITKTMGEDITNTTAWFLLRTETASSTNPQNRVSITFDWADTDYFTKNLPYCWDVAYNDNGMQWTESNNSLPACSGEIVNYIHSKVLKTITTSTQTVTFHHFQRQDYFTLYNGPNGDVLTTYGQLAVDKIEVKNGNYCVEYDLHHGYFVDPTVSGEGGKRLKLTGIRKKSCDGSISEPAWKFEYYSYINNGDTTQFFPKYLTKDLDHWNFYNFNQSIGTNDTDNDLIPYSFKTTLLGGTLDYGNSNRASYEPAMEIGLLKKVTYPTGGFTEYTYERNRYMDNNANLVQAFSLETCDTDCSNSQSDQTTIQLTGAMFNSGVLQLCIEAFDDIPNGGFDPNNNNVRLDIFTSTGSTFYTRQFDSEINLCDPIPVNQIRHFPSGDYLSPGQSYTFKVTSLNARGLLSLDYSSAPVEKTCGGMRIAQTRTGDGENSDIDIIRTYEYKKANSSESSGILFNQPQYAFVMNDYSVLFASNSIIPLSSLEGYHVSYSRVVIYQEDCSTAIGNCGDSDGNGYTEHIFNIEGNSSVYDNFPIAPVEARVLSGTLSEQQVWTGENTPQIESSQSILRFEDDDYSIVPGQTYKAQRITVWDGTDEVLAYPLTEYRHRTGVFRMGEVTATLDGFSTSTSYDYHPTNAVLAPVSVSSTNSDGKVTEQQTVYTVDHPDATMRSDFIGANMLTLPYRTKAFVDGQWLDGSRINYAYFNCSGDSISSFSCHPPKPHKTWRYERTWENGILQPGAWQLQSTIHQYTEDGLVKTVQQTGWENETYTYQNKLKTSSSFLNYTKNYEYYSGSSLVKKVTEVDGTSSSITYDSLMRAESVTEDCKNIVQTFSYHFANGTPGDRNYVETTESYPVDPTGASNIQTIVTREYRDGLGRTKIQVRRNQSPTTTANDLLIAREYDSQGRVSRTYEPKEFANNNGAYQAPDSSWPHTLTEYYSSPLNRTQQSSPPGWTNGNIYITTTYEYGSNTAADNVLKIGTPEYYEAGSLKKATVIDGNGNKSIVFTDRKGRTILSRQTDANETAAAHLDTYTLYDDKDRRTTVLPPGTGLGNVNLIYEYEYDGEDKLLYKKVPDKAPVQYSYSARDLMTGYQDGYLAAASQWMTYVYDDYGRELRSGFYNSATAPNPQTEPDELLLQTIYGTAGIEIDKPKTLKTKIMDGGNDWLETTNTYDACGRLLSQSSNNHVNLTTGSEGMQYFYDGADNVIKTIYNHNAHGNALDIIREEGYDHVGRNRFSLLTLGNEPRQTLSEKVYNYKDQLVTCFQGGDQNTALQEINYSYLENGLLKAINAPIGGTQSPIVSCAPELTSTPSNTRSSQPPGTDLFYLELAYDMPVGGVASQKNGNISAVTWQTQGRERQVYSLTYDVYDRLTEAKTHTINSSGGISYTGLWDVSLSYDKRGNIMSLMRKGILEAASGNCWEVHTIDNLHYEYYDGYNRLKTVDDYADCLSELYITQPVSKSDTYSADQRVIANSLVHGNSDVTYQAGDEICLNGGFEVETGTEFLAQTGVNCGSSPGAEGFKQNSNLEYLYDGNGNMTRDPNKGITVTYNHLDLATLVTFDDGKKIEMIYDASGTLLRKKQINSSGLVIETRDYISGTEYVDTEIESVYHSEGRAHFVSNSWRYEYILKDHLGNSRVVYYENNNVLEVLSEHHYYPHGYKMNGPWASVLSDAISYQFNSIDYVDDFGLNVNMATFRTLDPATGRWWSVDPLAGHVSNLSPCNSMYNTPLNAADPNGDCPACIGAAVGAVLNLGIQSAMGNINSLEDGLLAVGAGALGGALAGLGAANIGTAALNAAGSIISSYLPSISVGTQNFSLSISPSILFSTQGIGMGINFNAMLHLGPVTAGFGVGFTNMTSHITGQTGTEGRLGGSLGLDIGNFHASYSTTQFWSGETSQRTGAVTLGWERFRLTYENDNLGDNGDRFRTAALRLAYGDFSIGLNMFTGDPGPRENMPYKKIEGHDVYTGKDADKYRAGVLFAGYRNYRIGWNSELIRHVFQNRFAHDMVSRGKPKWFAVLPYPNSPYGFFGTKNPYTLW